MEQYQIGIILVILVIGIIIGYMFSWFKGKVSTSPASSVTASEPESGDHTARLYQLAAKTDDFFERTAHPKDLLNNETFQQGVAMLSYPRYTDVQLIEYYAGGNVLIGCMALEALRTRPLSEALVDQLIIHIGNRYIWSLFFAFRVLKDETPKPVVGAVLIKAPDWWKDEELLLQILKDFIDHRLKKGEQVTLGAQLDAISKQQLNRVQNLIDVIGRRGLDPLKNEIQEKLQTLVNAKFLNSVGRLWDPIPPDHFIHKNEDMEKILNRMVGTLTGDQGRSIILIGEAGVGKTTYIRALAERLAEKRQLIFEASAADLLAGQTYIGELENRLRKIGENIDRKRGIVWFVPGLHELLFAGRHRYSPAGILEMILPYVESGRICILGETRPAHFEQITREIPRIKTLFDILHIQPMEDNETLALANDWAALNTSEDNSGPLLAAETIKEALRMVKQFLSDYSAPGNLLDFLKLTQRNSSLEGRSVGTIREDQLYLTLSHVTGLPRAILDERQGLDIDELRDLFQRRVMGQTEAVNCLVERIAMIKAGLTDPSRPLGVFLFAGPTGTGKTEIAKTLAEFLFGSPDRMIRLDMSEFKTSTSEGRILGEYDQTGSSGALVHQIRKQPFSVVLLDEFEKAHANIWDLFLQVFDDGRLTDRQGNTANFRHAIIILTSNLGATIQPGSGIGFNPDTHAFSMHQVEKAIGLTFRREFINRLDRVVVFHPLSRSIMRSILFKELKNVLQRRGLRNRDWAVEWEESAISFLLEKGFTPDLGARPLKRAIEHHLLAPLSMTIVNHQHPEGGQFLFVRSGNNGIEVEFIDPDTPAADAVESPEILPPDPNEMVSFSGVKKLILVPEGTRAAVDHLEEVLGNIRATIQSDDWQAAKHDTLRQISDEKFWQRYDCYSILTQAEYMDRMEAALRTAGSLLQRLKGPQDASKSHYSIKMIKRLAEQLYLLVEADKTLAQNLPKDVYLMLENNASSLQGSAMEGQFTDQLLNMYLQWCQKRRMRWRLLQNIDIEKPFERPVILAVNGLGCYAILKDELGLHVLEIPKGGNAYNRINVRISVVGQPEFPIHNDEAHLKHAKECFAGTEATKAVIVRRYRHEPSPLVRDAKRNYRTGRIDRVLGGDFDLFGSS